MSQDTPGRAVRRAGQGNGWGFSAQTTDRFQGDLRAARVSRSSAMPQFAVNIDFDRVIEFYDLYVNATFDLRF